MEMENEPGVAEPHSGGISRNKAMAHATVGYADSEAARNGSAVIAVPGGPEGQSHFKEDKVIGKKPSKKREADPSIATAHGGALIPVDDSIATAPP
jgi:hypothetical protein